MTGNKDFLTFMIHCCLFMLCLLIFQQEAKEKFQQLQKVISILGDEEKRAVYDQTGCVDDAVSFYICAVFILNLNWYSPGSQGGWSMG